MNVNNNIENLITEIERRPVLWDFSKKEYRNILYKNKAWDAVAAAVGTDVGTVKTKWKYLRDAYMKNMKPSASGAAGGMKKTWCYSQRLNFLKGIISPRQTASNYETTPMENYENTQPANYDFDTAQLNEMNIEVLDESSGVGNLLESIWSDEPRDSSPKFIKSMPSAKFKRCATSQIGSDCVSQSWSKSIDSSPSNLMVTPMSNKKRRLPTPTAFQTPTAFHSVSPSTSDDTSTTKGKKKPAASQENVHEDFQRAIIHSLGSEEKSAVQLDDIQHFLASQHMAIKSMSLEYQEKTKLEIQTVVYKNIMAFSRKRTPSPFDENSSNIL